MKFELIINEIDEEVIDKISLVEEFSKKINIHLENETYSDNLDCYQMTCICVRPRLGYEDWFKIRKPRFKTINDEGIIINKFIHEIKLDKDEYELFATNQDKACLKMLSLKIIESISSLDQFPKKLNGFKRDNLINDLNALFDSMD